MTRRLVGYEDRSICTDGHIWESGEPGLSADEVYCVRCGIVSSVMIEVSVSLPTPPEYVKLEGVACVFCGKPVDNEELIVQKVYDGLQDGRYIRKRAGKTIVFHDVCDVPDEIRARYSDRMLRVVIESGCEIVQKFKPATRELLLKSSARVWLAVRGDEEWWVEAAERPTIEGFNVHAVISVRLA